MQRGLEITGTDLKAHASLLNHIYFHAVKLSQLKEKI